MKPLLAFLLALAVGPFLQAQTDPQEEAFCRQVIALVRLAPTDFREQRGPVAFEHKNSTSYAVDPLRLDLNTKAQFISVPKDGTAAEYRAVYTGEVAVKYAQTTFLGLAAIFSGSETLFRKGKNAYEGFSVDAQMEKMANGILVASLHYNGITVAALNIAATGNEATLYIGLTFSDNLPTDRAKLSPVPVQPEHVTVADTIITVKGLGPHFDGAYDVGKLPPNGCISGNCVDGHGRKVIASITATGPHIRILDGQFKNKLFAGDGVMLIDGEGPVLDGTYELGKFKENFYYELLAKTTFHPKYGKEAVKGNLRGCYDYSIGSDQPEYRQYIETKHRYISYEFASDDHEKNKTPVTDWERDIGFPAHIQRSEIVQNSPEMKAAQAANAAAIEREYGPQNIPPKDIPPPPGSQPKGERIKTTCFFCKGTGKIPRIEYDYGEAYGKKYTITRTVYDTCYKCGGSGKD